MVRHLVLIWLCLAATIAYVQRNSLGVAESTIREELGISLKEMGWINAAFFASYALLQLPSGWLAHRAGSRWALPWFSTLWSAFTGCLALVNGLGGLLATRTAMGAAQAGIFPCCTTTITKWFPATRRSLASGALAAFMSLGGALGSELTGRLIGELGWRALFAWYALPGVLWAIAFWLWFRDRPEMHSWVSGEELATIHGDAGPIATVGAGPLAAAEPIPWGMILSRVALWWIGLQQFFRAAGYIFFATWFATYLQETRGVSVKESGSYNAWPLLAVVLGSLLGGWVSDSLVQWTGSRRIGRQFLAAASLMCCAALVVAAYFIRDTTLAVLTISAGQFFASIAGPSAYAITMDLGGRHVTTVFSFMNMCGNAGAAVFPLLVPFLVAKTGSWDAVLFAFAGIHAAGALCWLCFNGNRPLLPAASARST